MSLHDNKPASVTGEAWPDIFDLMEQSNAAADRLEAFVASTNEAGLPWDAERIAQIKPLQAEYARINDIIERHPRRGEIVRKPRKAVGRRKAAKTVQETHPAQRRLQ